MIFAKLFLLFITLRIGRLGAIKTGSLMIGNSVGAEIEHMLIEFISDLNKLRFKRIANHRLIFLGKNKHFLQASKVLLASGTPYFVSTKAEAIILPSHFGAESVVLFFIDGFSDSEVNSTFSNLPNDYKCEVLLISLEEDRTYESVDAITASAFKMKLKNVFFVRFDGKIIKIYGNLLHANCELKVTSINTWKPNKGFDRNRTFAMNNERAIMNSHGCTYFVSTFKISPTMRLQEGENKSLQITGGLEGRLIKSIARHLNMTLVVKVPSVKEKLWVTPDGTLTGIVGEVARGVTSFGIGQIKPSPERGRLVDFSASYNHECIKWTVPLRFRYNYNIVISEFSPFTWIIVILSVSLCCGLVWVTPRLKIGCSSSLNIFDVIAMTLNYAIPRQPSGVLCKSFFLVYLHYSRVLTTAYSTSLSSILTTMTPEPTIVDEEGILAAGLRTAGTQCSRMMLANQISPNSTKAELIDRFEVITSVEAALRRISDRQDIAYLRHHSAINYAGKKLLATGKAIKFYPLPGCVISYNPVIVTRKGSRLTHHVNNIVLRLSEAGIYNHWMRIDDARETPIKTANSNDHTLVKLQSIFLLYFYCLIPAFLAFIVELIVFKLQPNYASRVETKNE